MCSPRTLSSHLQKFLHVPGKSNLLFTGQKQQTNKQKSTPLSGDAVNVPGESSGALCAPLPASVYHPVECGCLHGDVPPPFPVLTHTG